MASAGVQLAPSGSAAQNRIWRDMANPEKFYQKHRQGDNADRLISAHYLSFEGRRYHRILLLAKPFRNNLKRLLDIVDFGCGMFGHESADPIATNFFAPESYDIAARVIGTWEGIDCPQRLCNRRVSSANIAAKTSVAVNSKDVVILNRVFTNGTLRGRVPLIEGVLTEATRVLRPGGIIIGTVARTGMGRHEASSRHPITDSDALRFLKENLDFGGYSCKKGHGFTVRNATKSGIVVQTQGDDLYFVAAQKEWI